MQKAMPQQWHIWFNMQTLLAILAIYFVSFISKPGSETPALGERALEQRTTYNIPIDSLDYPVSTVYLDSLRALGATVMHSSRWFNGATVSVPSTETLNKIQACSFVRQAELTRDDSTLPIRKSALYQHAAEALLAEPYLPTDPQINMLNLKPLHDLGYHGEGIHIAVMDGGFQNADKLDWALDHTLAHYDLTDDKGDFFGTEGDHGTMCLSTMAASLPDYEGTATGASYVLMRTEEYVTESPKEMDNLVAALEIADSLGINIASISLGYYDFDNNQFDLTYSQMDGHQTRASLGATIAARKGMLVCVAAGNEGNKSWHYIDVPADADSILAVGALDSLEHVTGFSSRGPSSDGRVKPDVSAMGGKAAVVNPNGAIERNNGTSFACPIIAGMAATLWSALPEENAMQIRERIIRSASRYEHPDGDYGYGIPDAYLAYKKKTSSLALPDSPHPVAEKRLLNGQLIIIRNHQSYSIQGTPL